MMNDPNKKPLSIVGMGFVASIVCIVLILNYIEGKNTDNRVVMWWIALSLISILNFCLWGVAFLAYKQHSAENTTFKEFRKYYPWLSLVYVIVCAYRSFLPRAYVKRWVLVDSWWSNVFMARLGATVAEICFIILIALYLKEVSERLDSKIGLYVVQIIVPAICVAQCFSWANVITTNNLFAIIEESIWGVCGLLILIATITFYKKVEPKNQTLVLLLAFFVLSYVLFMFVNDVPKYIMRYMADQEAGKTYISFSEGVSDLLNIWYPTYEYENWKNEMLWLALYFSFAVWMTIYLINAPLIEARTHPNT